MTSLAQELADDQRLGSSCLLCTYIRSLPVGDQAEWHAELARPATVVSHASVLRALEKRGVAITESSVKRHRRHHA